MIKQTSRILKKLPRLFYIVAVAAVVTGPGTLSAVQLVCEPGCPMHQVQAPVHPCCESAGNVSHPQPPGPGGTHEQQAALPFGCDGQLCFDSSVDIQKIAALSSGWDDSAPPVCHLQALPPLPLTNPPRQLFLTETPPGPAVPIYLRTCVFLI